MYLWAFREVVPRLLSAFRPDVLVTQLGIDTHLLDPITPLALTTQGFAAGGRGVRQDRAACVAGARRRRVRLQAVSRAWTMAFAAMAGQELADELPESYRSRYGVRG